MLLTQAVHRLIQHGRGTLVLALLAGCAANPTSTIPAKPMTPTVTTTGSPARALRLAGYFFGSNRNNRVSDIPAAQLTDVIYAFADVSSAGECASDDPALDQANFSQLRQVKQQYPALKALISIGGYDHSGNFSDVALTSDSRRKFEQSCIQFMKENGLDGIDIDWELPVNGGKKGNAHRPEDRENFTKLLGEFRQALDSSGESDGLHYRLTIAGPAGPSAYANIELDAIQQYLDWINLEAYAFYTAGSPTTNFNAPLFASSSDPDTNQTKRLSLNGDAAVRGYLAAGVPPIKLALGVPFYGRGWKGVPDVNHGLFQIDSGPATDPSVPESVWKDGAIDYGDLEKYYLSIYPRYWSDEAQEPWLYNPGTGIMITYEDPQSLGLKANYVKAQHLGGMVIWHLSDDDAQHSLVNALYSRLANP